MAKKSIISLAAVACLLHANIGHGRLFWPTYGSTVPTRDGLDCAWNANQDFFVPRHCDSGRYDLFGACTKSAYASPACRRMHPGDARYCTPYGSLRSAWRNCVYRQHCRCSGERMDASLCGLDFCWLPSSRTGSRCLGSRAVPRSSACASEQACGGAPGDACADRCCGMASYVEPRGGESLGTFSLRLIGGFGVGGGIGGGGLGGGGLNGVGTGLGGTLPNQGVDAQSPNASGFGGAWGRCWEFRSTFPELTKRSEDVGSRREPTELTCGEKWEQKPLRRLLFGSAEALRRLAREPVEKNFVVSSAAAPTGECGNVALGPFFLPFAVGRATKTI